MRTIYEGEGGTVFVKEWLAHSSHHRVVDERGREAFMDLFVDGGMPAEATPENIVGKRVRIAYAFPYSWIASEPRLVDDES